MEVFAGMLAYEDHEIGRLLNELQRMGQFNNTLVMFLEGDNGASAEGGLAGTQNEVGLFGNGVSFSISDTDRSIKLMGGPHSEPLYPAPWAWAMDTPFQWTKQIASHLGGMTNGLVISWPGHVADEDKVRSQFSYITDIFPTILEAVGVPRRQKWMVWRSSRSMAQVLSLHLKIRMHRSIIRPNILKCSATARSMRMGGSPIQCPSVCHGNSQIPATIQ